LTAAPTVSLLALPADAPCVIEDMTTTTPRRTFLPCDARARFDAGTEGIKGRWKVNGVRGVVRSPEPATIEECAQASLNAGSSTSAAYSYNADIKKCWVLRPLALTAPVPTNVASTKGWVLYVRLAPAQDRCSEDYVLPAMTPAAPAQTTTDSPGKREAPENVASTGCPGGDLHRFELPRSNTRGKYLKGTGLVRKDATLRGDAALCAAACLEERECEAFSVKNKKSCT